MSPQYALKLLNGPLAEQVLQLPEGELRIGGEDPDLALPTTGGHVVRLQIDSAGVHIADAVPCWVDGQAWATPGNLPLGRAIDLDGIGFVLGPSDTPFPERTLPRRRSARPLRWLAGAAMLIGGIALALAGIGGSAAPSPIPVAPDHPTWLRAQAAGLNLTGLETAWDEHDVVTLSGSCRNMQQLDHLRRALRQQGIGFRDQMVCDDELVRSVTAVLHLHGFDQVDVRLDTTPGHVLLTGAIRTDAEWELAMRQLSKLPGVADWTVRNEIDGSLAEMVEQLRADGVLQGLSIRRAEGKLLLSGHLTLEEERSLRQTLARYGASHPSVLTAFHNIPSSASLAQWLPAPAQSIGGSMEAPVLLLTNGMRLEKGSRLANGDVVTALTPSGVALLNDERLLYLPLDL